MKLLDLVESLRASPAATDKLLKAFVDANTFPLVEGDTATFFFWDGEPTKGVNLMHWVFGLETRQPFTRILGTDAFYLSLELPHRARVEYKFELLRGGRRRWIRDPRNDLQAFDPFGSNSVCPMPGYEEPNWIHPAENCRRGRIESFTLKSAEWGDEREVTMYLPNEYKPHKRYPLLLCHDGRDYRRFANMVDVLDALIHRREVRPLVVAFVDGVDRNREYGANPRQTVFLVDELLPAVRARYGVTKDPAETGVMGASFGAVSSLFAHWQRPDVFGKLLLQSGSFVFTDVGHHGRSELFDPVVEFVNALRNDTGKLEGRTHLSCGVFESLIQFNRALLPLLRERGMDVRYSEAQDGHNWIAWRDRLRDGLTWLYPGHLWMWYD
ncbi:MAG: esterase family protein [Myxococcales bacterium]|nr:esterase family protein [Myxococcales bacterium]MCB9671082.1 esterase family protein [Alphaproteobacteria bacterium]MCB9692338.1 esterase family protein [Alphaproteobacteria bacterium]